ncbi:MAG: DUF4230 domain-containing protein [Croceivirga sp.]
MKKVIAGILITLATLLIYKSYQDHRQEKNVLKENSMLLQQQLENVAKLIVTEGHFAEVYNYADSKALFGPLITASKKALVVVNAEVTIAYDLQQLDIKIDSATKTVRIAQLPDPEIKIYPDFEYYDVSADYLNPFEAEDYNTIKRNVNASLMKKVMASGLVSNADNRLLSELSKILVLTDSMGWSLVYQENPIKKMEDLRLVY